MNNISTSRLGSLVLIAAILAILSVAIMMFGARFGLWQPIVGFGLVRQYMNLIAYSIFGLGMVGVLYYLLAKNRNGSVKSFIAVVIGFTLLLPMILSKVNPPVRMPPIHDISTDTLTPPSFIALDNSREGARNSLVYGGPEVAALQQQFYPDIAPIFSDISPINAFSEALRVADAMGWEIVSEDASSLRFEASAKTFVYQFVDDVVVIVTDLDDKSRIDIRSVSRIGRGDRGVNAQRVRDFIAAFGQ